VTRIQEGWSHTTVAAFLGVHPDTVGVWWARHRADPLHGLDAKPRRGQPPKLTPEQETVVLSWFDRSATEFGFPNELWTGGRVAQLIERTFGVHFHPNYVNTWLARRRISPQKPEKQARERDPAKVEQWLADEAVEVKKKLRPGPSSS
jgi:transposase